MNKKDGSASYLRRGLVALAFWLCLLTWGFNNYFVLKQSGTIESFRALYELPGEQRIIFLVVLATNIVLCSLVFYYIALYIKSKRINIDNT